MNKEINKDSVFVNDDNSYGKNTIAVPKPEINIGIDTSSKLIDNIVGAGESSKIDLTTIQSFTQVSQKRDEVYNLLDTMCEDSTISAILETYAEDSTECNEQGQIVWVESSDSKISKLINYMLDTMRVEKNIYKWVYSLCKYGDLYLRLYRESDINDDDLLNSEEDKNTKSLNEQLDDINKPQELNEDVCISVHSQNDHYVHYVEAVANPAEIFELTRFGKTAAYIKADVKIQNSKVDKLGGNVTNQYQIYKFNKNDVTVHSATDYVHASLEDNSSRTPEEVQIFLNNDKETNQDSKVTYVVKRGQSLLYNVFKIWRELALLENSVLLNRITKSSIVRVVNVEVGDMPKEMVQTHLRGIKTMIEQKSAVSEGNSMAEYTNPGPIENNIYVPMHGGQGAITTTQIGGDVETDKLFDLDYYQNKFFGAMRIPKQYFGLTDDGAGFSGGESLAIISSRYAKMVKRIQNTIIQAITDVINLMLLDKGFKSYINKFTIKMQPPTTQEEKDRRDNLSTKVALVSDIMNLLSDVDDNEIKIKILKSMLSNVVSDVEVIDLLDEYIDKIENENTTNEESDDVGDMDISSHMPSSFDSGISNEPLDLGGEINNIGEEQPEETVPEEPSGETILPSPEDLGAGDLTDNTLEI